MNTYPVLKILKDGFTDGPVFVLFSGPSEGIVVTSYSTDRSFRFGLYLNVWREECFEKYDGSVVITNGEAA